MRHALAVAQITLLESLYKKHLYVLLLLLVGIYFWFSRYDFFNLGYEASFLKLVPLVGMSFFGLLISVIAAARQVPDEIAQKTIYPLLAKPLTRFQFLVGKFTGVFTVVAVSMAAVAATFHLLLASKGISINRIYWQAVILLILQMGVVIALVLMLSSFLSHAATVVISFLLFYLLGSPDGSAGRTLEDLMWADALPASMKWFYQALLHGLPRLDLFNISKAVVHDADPRSWTIVLPFIGYAGVCIVALLLLASVFLTRKDV